MYYTWQIQPIMKSKLNLIPPAEQPKKVSESFLEIINALFPAPRNEEDDKKYMVLSSLLQSVKGLERDIDVNKSIRYGAAQDCILMELDKKYSDCLNVIARDLMGGMELYEILKCRLAEANGYKIDTTELEVRKKYQ